MYLCFISFISQMFIIILESSQESKTYVSLWAVRTPSFELSLLSTMVCNAGSWSQEPESSIESRCSYMESWNLNHLMKYLSQHLIFDIIFVCLMHSDRSVVISHSSTNFYFIVVWIFWIWSNPWWCWTSFHIICLLSVYPLVKCLFIYFGHVLIVVYFCFCFFFFLL